MIKVNINGNDGSVSMSICGALNTISAETTMIVGLVYKSIKENQGKLVADRFKKNVKTTIESDFVFMEQNERDSYIKSVKDKIKNDIDIDDDVLQKAIDSMKKIDNGTASKDDKEEFAKTIMESIRKALRKKEDSETVDKDIEDIVSKLYKPETDNDTGGVE